MIPIAFELEFCAFFGDYLNLPIALELEAELVLPDLEGGEMRRLHVECSRASVALDHVVRVGWECAARSELPFWPSDRGVYRPPPQKS